MPLEISFLFSLDVRKLLHVCHHIAILVDDFLHILLIILLVWWWWWWSPSVDGGAFVLAYDIKRIDVLYGVHKTYNDRTHSANWCWDNQCTNNATTSSVATWLDFLLILVNSNIGFFFCRFHLIQRVFCAHKLELNNKEIADQIVFSLRVSKWLGNHHNVLQRPILSNYQRSFLYARIS